MRIAIIHTVGSPCHCAEYIAGGLKTLGHEPVIINADGIEVRAREISRTCDLVIDHTDTFRGRGLFRSYVRLVLETHGARLAGSDAKTCLLADHKALAKTYLSRSGIPTPPGITVASREFTIPEWLQPPFIVKPAFEHMSRGLYRAMTEKDVKDIAARLLHDLSQPVMIEMYIPGRELAVSLLDGSGGPEVLPPLEWLPGTAGSILTEPFKLREPVGKRDDVVVAGLSPDLLIELTNLARLAFKTLNLRDYARFDVRLSPGGTFYFLEANITPSLEPLEALSLSAQWAGLEYPALLDRILAAALQRYKDNHAGRSQTTTIQLPSGPMTLETPEGVHAPTASSVQLAKHIDVRPGECVLDLGCGSGVLSIAAAKLGARLVMATDLSSEALDAAKANAFSNGVRDKIVTLASSWYDGLEEHILKMYGIRWFDVIIATPPQTPGPGMFGPKFGGLHGIDKLMAIIENAPLFLEPKSGRLWLLAITLADTATLLARLRQKFLDVSIVNETERVFTYEEYNLLEPGLFDYLTMLRDTGIAAFRELGNVTGAFRNLVIRACGLRSP
ncbi:MAG: 50S ribosomal protein L11 methyltransferase [Syntrophorhabdaceae bacterium]|nr:50S ribosomal protein L11 methyltransferase [Syntrophorhabdaceae bacterium]